MDAPISLVLRTLVARFSWLVILLTVGGGVAAGAYAFLTPRMWMAYQPMVVRDELLGTSARPGRFESAEQLRAAQETVRTVARSREVIRSVLAQLEPPADYTDSVWPSDEYLEDYSADISISAANGAEFGQTEVVVLGVSERSPERAAQVVAFLTQELAIHLSQLRDSRFGSMEQELESGLLVAQNAVNQASEDLAKIEKAFGADLSEMRSMNDPSGSEGPLRRQLGITRQDLVVAQQRLGDLETQLNYLREIAAAPASIVSTPESILVLHPELRRLKESMIDSAVNLSRQLAQYDAEHPRLTGAEAANKALSAELRIQLDSAVKGTEFERDIVTARLTELRSVEKSLIDRISLLSASRVDYSDAVHRAERRKTELARIESELTEVRAARQAASLSAVISPIGPPKSDTRPAGTGRTVIAIAGAGGGFILSIGIIALWFDPRSLTAPSTEIARAETVMNPPAVAPVEVARRTSQPLATHTPRQPESTATPATKLPTVAPAIPTVAAPASSATSSATPSNSPSSHSSGITITAPDPQVDIEAQRWKAIEELSKDLAHLRTAISEKRSQALADELARYEVGR